MVSLLELSRPLLQSCLVRPRFPSQSDPLRLFLNLTNDSIEHEGFFSVLKVNRRITNEEKSDGEGKERQKGSNCILLFVSVDVEFPTDFSSTEFPRRRRRRRSVALNFFLLAACFFCLSAETNLALLPSLRQRVE